MPQKEQVTNQNCIFAMNSTITTDTDTNGSIIDTADYDLGVFFVVACVGFDNTAAEATLAIEDGDESDLSDATTLTTVNLVYGSTVTLDALSSVGSLLPKEGVVGCKRYIRPVITTTGVDTSMQVIIIAVCNAEVCPTSQS